MRVKSLSGGGTPIRMENSMENFFVFITTDKLEKMNLIKMGKNMGNVLFTLIAAL